MTEPRDDGDLDLSAEPQRAPLLPIHEDIDEPQPTPPRQRAPRTAKGAAILSARLVSGLIGIAAAAAVITAIVAVPLPSAHSEPPSVVVTPVAAQQQRVCSGPLLRLGDDMGAQATTASALGEARTTTGTSGDVDGVLAPVDGSDTASDSVTLETGDDDQELLAAAQSQSISRGDFVGTAAAECVEPRDDIWLVGGSTTTGRTTLLKVTNPGDVAATIDISVYSDSGEITAPGTTGIAIAPGEHRVYSLAGLTPGLATPVVRVQSDGALVVASLQQSTVRTLEPGGLDFVTASAAPSTEVTIPGILFPDHDDLEAAIAGEDYIDLNAALRVFVPGDAQAHAVVTMVPVADEGGSADDPVEISVSLDPGRVTELPVSEYEAGRYVAVITSSVPVVAGMRVAAVGDDGANDFSWVASAEAVHERVLAAVARGSNPVMTLHNPRDERAEVQMSLADEDSTVSVPAGSSVSVSVDQNSIYLLEGFDELRVAVDFAGDGTVTTHSVSPRAPASTPIVVYP